MREIWSEVERWRQAGKSVALATVVDVEGSSLRPLASKMAVTSSGDIAGSVSGGCVEGAIYEEAQTVIKNGTPVLLSYGVPDPAAWSVGLACGGSIQVFVETLDAAPWGELAGAIQECLETHQLAALVTVLAGAGAGNKILLWPDGRRMGDLGTSELNERAASLAESCWTSQGPARATIPTRAETVDVFVDICTPQPRLVIVGAVHIAIPLISIARTMNFRTIVVDPRSAFATRERFPHVDEIIVEWPSTALQKLHPDPATYIVCLSHDDKLDNPALQAALSTPARYVGILGSRKTHLPRIEALREMGVSEGEIARIHAPVGLELGARYPEEIALSIMAEIIAVRHGVPVGRDTFQAIHSS